MADTDTFFASLVTSILAGATVAFITRPQAPAGGGISGEISEDEEERRA